MKILIVGCGYVGRAVLNHLPSSSNSPHRVFALTRNKERVPELESIGAEPVVGHWMDRNSLSDLPNVDCVLVSVPHRADADLNTTGSSSGQSLDEKTHQIGLQNLLDALPNRTSKLIYLSTTGVYGDCQGEIMNENSPISPTRIGPQIAATAEEWLRNQPDWKPTILRLAGIYGPGRLPLAAKLRSNEPLEVPQEGYLNLGHVDDIARVIWQIAQHDLSRDTYVFSDGNPVLRREFYLHLASLCGVSAPIFKAPPSHDSASTGASRARRATNKRIDPSRLVEELDFKYLYPSYREGLAASV